VKLQLVDDPDGLDETGAAFNLLQRGGSDVRFSFADRNQLRLSVEGHFGVVSAALRGVSQWRSWVTSEVFASIIPEFRDRLGLRARPRRGRAHRMGAVVSRDAGNLVEPFPHDMIELGAARAFVSGGEAGDDGAFLEYLGYLVTGFQDEPGAEVQSPFAGAMSAARAMWR
jgi:hypothetical protein